MRAIAAPFNREKGKLEGDGSWSRLAELLCDANVH